MDEHTKFILTICMSITLVIILIVVIFVLKEMTEFKYLNYNSTFFGGSAQFNPSDIAYEEVADELDKQAEIMTYIKKILNAGDNAKVIFTSGATEGIATVMHWCNNVNKYGVVVGSRLDHESVKTNAENYGYEYKILNVDKIRDIPENVAMLFITHVSSKTGEIYPLSKLPKMQYLTKTTTGGGDEPETTSTGVVTLQQRPLRILDITQSIGKIPIDMTKYDIDAAMFSMHKLGGELNTGVLVIRNDFKFTPLIAGSQQNGSRGGTYDAYAFDKLPMLMKEYPYDIQDCKTRWLSAVKYLNEHLDSESRLKPRLLEPRLDHVFNTLLIQLDDCGLGTIKRLSEKGIYVSSSSACSTKNKDKYIRISFLKSSDLTNKALEKIVKEINED